MPPVETVETVPPVGTAVVTDVPPVETVAVETVAPVDPLEPTTDDSVLADMPDTTTGKEQLRQNDEGRPGPAV